MAVDRGGSGVDAQVAVVAGVGGCLPPRRVTNDDLSAYLETSDAWIRTRTGIGCRRWVDAGTSTGDLAVAAGRGALESAQAPGADLVIVATTTPDRRCPATAPDVAWRLGLRHAAAFDLNAVCAGFVYALAMGVGQITSGAHERVLVIGADTFSTLIDPLDRSTAVVFGDGAGAVLLRQGKPHEPGAVVTSSLGSDGEGSDLVAIEAGGARKPVRQPNGNHKDQYLVVRGRQTYLQAVRRMTDVTLKVAGEAGWPVDTLDALVAHQANQRILDAVAERLELPPGRCVGNIRDVGNTAAASVPLALADAAARGVAPAGGRAVLTAFGGGLAWGAVAMTWPAARPVYYAPQQRDVMSGSPA